MNRLNFWVSYYLQAICFIKVSHILFEIMVEILCLIHIGHILHEVVVEAKRDAQQQLQIDGVLAEDVVEACALQSELLG